MLNVLNKTWALFYLETYFVKLLIFLARTQPFYVRFQSDKYEMMESANGEGATPGKGFQLGYFQTATGCWLYILRVIIGRSYGDSIDSIWKKNIIIRYKPFYIGYPIISYSYQNNWYNKCCCHNVIFFKLYICYLSYFPTTPDELAYWPNFNKTLTF